MPLISYRDALNQAMREEMARDDRVFLMGEEVGQYNGAYKVSQGLLKEFGPWRVVDTPIAELGFVGIGVGAAVNGLRPIVEVMTWNFALLAMDQIVNSAAKMRQMSGGQLSVPIVIRGPQGAAHQLAAQHSQVFEAHYAHVPGLKVAVPATPRDAKGLLKSAIRDDNPVIFMESEILYGSKGEVEEGEIVIPFGQAEIVRPGRDVTLVAWQKARFTALAAAQELAQDRALDRGKLGRTAMARPSEIDVYIVSDAAVLDDEDAVGQRDRFRHVVGDQDGGEPLVPPNALQQALHRNPRQCIERAKRLVESKQPGMAHERASQRDPLLLPPRE